MLGRNHWSGSECVLGVSRQSGVLDNHTDGHVSFDTGMATAFSFPGPFFRTGMGRLSSGATQQALSRTTNARQTWLSHPRTRTVRFSSSGFYASGVDRGLAGFVGDVITRPNIVETDQSEITVASHCFTQRRVISSSSLVRSI